MGHYIPLLLELLEKVKTHIPRVIPDTMLAEDFSLWRSGCHGALTEAANQGVPQMMVDLMGRWRTKEVAWRTLPGLPMQQVYTQMKSAVPALLLFGKYF